MGGICRSKRRRIFKEELYVQRLHRVTPIEPVVKIVAGLRRQAADGGGDGRNPGDLRPNTLTAMKVIQHFQAIVTADDVKHGKPAPDIFLEAARRLNVPPEKCYAFEDGELGSIARAAGMVAIDVRPMR